jgi:hypothetical protein
MEKRHFIIGLILSSVTVVLSVLSLNALGLSPSACLFVSVGAGMCTFVLMSRPGIYKALKSGLRRLLWILFAAGLLALGVLVGWTDLGFLAIYLLGVSALTLFAVMAIASIFKNTRFGRELSERIVEGMLYGVAFMRLPRKRARGDVGSYIKVIQMNLSRSFECP